MIILSLKGGLGNQLFQYACGRSLSIINNNALKLDITGYARTQGSDTPRNYLLQHFNISNNQIISKEELEPFKYPHGIISKGWRLIRSKLFRQFNIDYNPSILKQKGDVYLEGFFQTEKYFDDITDTIKKEFTLKKPLSPDAQTIANKILETTSSVSLHVRRGDVARDAATNLYYGITTPLYYAKALSYIKEKIPDIHIFIFSDDIEWAKKNIPIDLRLTYITNSSGQNLPEYEELILMSMCHHNIIANSSFSWWGAWLNQNPDKIVIAPQKWIQKYQHRHKNICPVSWIRI